MKRQTQIYSRRRGYEPRPPVTSPYVKPPDHSASENNSASLSAAASQVRQEIMIHLKL